MAKMERDRRSLIMPMQPTIQESRDPRLEEFAGQLKMAESELQTAQREVYVLDRKMAEAEVKLDIVQQAAPERLPASVVDDSRYLELKREYEAAVLEGAGADATNPEASAELKRRTRILKTWVEQIYLPEQKEALQALRIQRERLNQDLDVSRMKVTELREEMVELQNRQAEERAEALNRARAAESNAVPVPPDNLGNLFESGPR